MTIAVLGSGAFGTALALALASDGTHVALWGRDTDDTEAMSRTRKSGRKLPGFDLPKTVTPHSEMNHAIADINLLAVPTQQVAGFTVEHHARFSGKTVIACCKGIDIESGLGPADLLAEAFGSDNAGILTGPSFAVDIAKGLPTALVLASASSRLDMLQDALTRPALRIYTTEDVAGAQFGGALKNVIALAAGMSIGAGFGDSARAAVIARGFSEMVRYAKNHGADAATLSGLSGLGDLVLTCTSEKSRNFASGLRLGRGDPVKAETVEGIATADALTRKTREDDMPITHAVHAVASGRISVDTAVERLLSRPVTKE